MPFLYAWNEASVSAKALAGHSKLAIKRIKHENSRFQGSPKKTVINWGAGNVPDEVRKSKVLNHPDAVKQVSDKRVFFEMVEQTNNGCRVVDWTTNGVQAMKWWKAKHDVVVRLKTKGHSGDGIVFFSDQPDNLDELLKAPLFTLYKPKKEEYRIHVFKTGGVVDVQQKKLRTTDDEGNKIDPDRIDFRIRNLANGFIFAREDVKAPDDVLKQAVLALACTKLDFGAVDIVWNEKEGQAYVLEINTAPGLEGTTVDRYAEALTKIL